MNNKYIDDSKIFFHRCTPLISEKIKKPDIIDAILFYAIGIEKTLKGILWNINPVYILTDQTFQNSAPLLYSNKLLPSHTTNKEISREPKDDVLTYRKSLLRAKELGLFI